MSDARKDLNAAPADQVRRLQWRARRGLLENDLLLRRFFERCAGRLDPDQAGALAQLLELPDGELLDLLLARAEPAPPLDSGAVRNLLNQIRSA